MRTLRIIKALDFENEEFIRNQSVKLSLLSSKINEDLIELIKIELRKKLKEDYIYDENKKNNLLILIKKIIPLINKSIYNNYNYPYKSKNKHINISDEDFKLIYNIIFLVFKHFPNKLFELEKYKLSNVRKYFIYKINIKPEYKHKVNRFNEKFNSQYIIFDYSHYEDYKELYINVAKNLDNVKKIIKKYLFMLNPIINKNRPVSLNNSEKSNPFNSSNSYHSSKSLSSSRSSNSS